MELPSAKFSTSTLDTDVLKFSNLVENVLYSWKEKHCGKLLKVALRVRLLSLHWAISGQKCVLDTIY